MGEFLRFGGRFLLSLAPAGEDTYCRFWRHQGGAPASSAPPRRTWQFSSGASESVERAGYRLFTVAAGPLDVAGEE